MLELNDFSNISKNIGSINIPVATNSIPPEIQRQLNENYQRRKQAELAAIEQNQTAKDILNRTQQMNESLIQVNKGLEKVNDSLEKQLQAINNNIDFVINSLGANAQIDEKQQKVNQQLLVDIQMLLQNKDEKGLKAFIEKNIGNGIGIMGLLLQGISML